MTTTTPAKPARGPDLVFVRTWIARYWLPIWFGIISVMRLESLTTGGAGFDAQLYLKATRAWLNGADPWVFIDQQRFAAPPPTLIPLAPIAILPEQVGIALMIALAVAGAVATVRLLHLPWWWLLFPPFIDAAWNGNPQNLLVPLILVGAGPLAAFLKIYAVIPIALVALLLTGRERAAWLAVPAVWPTTQWYYSTLAVPAVTLTPLAAGILAIPIPGAAVVATVVVAVSRRNTTVDKLTADWRPGPTTLPVPPSSTPPPGPSPTGEPQGA